MKISRVFLVVIVIAMVAVIFLEMKMPKHFEWNPTFSHNDAQPLGAMVLDSIVASSVKQGYAVTPKSIKDVYKSGVWKGKSLLVVSPRMWLKGENYEIGLSHDDEKLETVLLDMVKNGTNVMLVTDRLPDGLDTLLRMESTVAYSRFGERELPKTGYIDPEKVDDDLNWVDSSYTERVYPNPRAVTHFRFSFVSTDHRILLSEKLSGEKETLSTCKEWRDNMVNHQPLLGYRASDDDAVAYDESEDDASVVEAPEGDEATGDDAGLLAPAAQGDYEVYMDDCFAVECRQGEGKLILVSTPLLFTNYGILYGNNSELIMRLLTRLGPRPIMRVDLYSTDLAPVEDSQSIFRYLLRNDPLRMAFYTLLTAMLIYLIFMAKRRRKPIPVIKEPANLTVDMVEHLGDMYCHYHDNRDLLSKEYDYFAQDMRLKAMAELNYPEERDDALSRIATLSAIDRSEVESIINRVEEAIGNYDERIKDKELASLIDGLNKINDSIN